MSQDFKKSKIESEALDYNNSVINDAFAKCQQAQKETCMFSLLYNINSQGWVTAITMNLK